MKSTKQIQTTLTALEDRLYWDGYRQHKEKEHRDEVLRIEKKYGKTSLKIRNDEEYAQLVGQVAALRWVLDSQRGGTLLEGPKHDPSLFEIP